MIADRSDHHVYGATVEVYRASGKRDASYRGRQAEEECDVRWNVKSATKRYVTGSMWLVPVFALLFYQLFVQVTFAFEAWLT